MKIKIRALLFFKKFVSTLTSCITKSKNKSGSTKTRLFLFSLMHVKKMLFDSITSKFHDLLEKESDDGDEAVVAHAGVDGMMDLDADDHCDGGTPSSSETDGAKDSVQEVGELEDEIDRVADRFIRRFHREMKMQKMESFKRLQEMLQRSI